MRRFLIVAVMLVGAVAVASVASAQVTANPTNIPSGGTTQLSAPNQVWGGSSYLPVSAWDWSDGGAGGIFWPYAQAQNPTWTGPGNFTGTPVQRLLRVALIVGTTEEGYQFVTVTEDTAPHVLTVTASVGPATAPVGTPIQLSASASDDYGHTAFTWAWTDSAGGSYVPGAGVAAPIYYPPAEMAAGGGTVTLTATASCGIAPTTSGIGTALLTVQANPPASSFLDVPESYWAYRYIEACYRAGIVEGYPGGNYRPEESVTRAQMAVYFARALGLVSD